jgi:hypothetical protein
MVTELADLTFFEGLRLVGWLAVGGFTLAFCFNLGAFAYMSALGALNICLDDEDEYEDGYEDEDD